MNDKKRQQFSDIKPEVRAQLASALGCDAEELINSIGDIYQTDWARVDNPAQLFAFSESTQGFEFWNAVYKATKIGARSKHYECLTNPVHDIDVPEEDYPEWKPSVWDTLGTVVIVFAFVALVVGAVYIS